MMDLFRHLRIHVGGNRTHKRLPFFCPRCHATTQPIVVHGHTQCSVCKFYIEECCQGNECQPGTAGSAGKATDES